MIAVAAACIGGSPIALSHPEPLFDFVELGVKAKRFVEASRGIDIIRTLMLVEVLSVVQLPV
jgi:hypothetical protein